MRATRAALLAVLPLLPPAAAAAGAAASIEARPSPAIRAKPAPDIVSLDVIRIGLFDSLPEVRAKGTTSLVVFDQASGRRRVLPAGQELRLKADGPGSLEAVLTGKGTRFTLDGAARLSPARPEGRIIAQGKPYRGSIILKAGPEGLSVVNELGLEEYLYGVLPLEMAADWPPEALKAQAVIARSYAVYNLGRFGTDGFDLSSDERSQIYDGSGSEDPRATQSVEETAGQVLAYHGTIINAYFHSCCGGHTATVATVWGGDGKDPYRPFQGVRDTWCSVSPYYSWKIELDRSDLLRALQRGGMMVTRLDGVSIAQRDFSGYIRTLKVATDQGKELVRANLLRRWIGNGHIKSTNWTRIKDEGDEFVIEGHGYGHGVGLCQWGARAQAQHGRGYRRILQFYYPGTVLRVLDE